MLAATAVAGLATRSLHAVCFVRTATHRGMHENGGDGEQMHELCHGQWVEVEESQFRD